jgi:hypothetical protein
LIYRVRDEVLRRELVLVETSIQFSFDDVILITKMCTRRFGVSFVRFNLLAGVGVSIDCWQWR